SKMEIRNLSLYILTSELAVNIGLVLVNLIQPGNFIGEDTRQEMLTSFGGDVQLKVDEANQTQEGRGPLQPLVEVVPENIVGSMADNGNMLQVIFFSLLVEIGRAHV